MVRNLPWFILLVFLLVPAILFYRWHTDLSPHHRVQTTVIEKTSTPKTVYAKNTQKPTPGKTSCPCANISNTQETQRPAAINNSIPGKKSEAKTLKNALETLFNPMTKRDPTVSLLDLELIQIRRKPASEEIEIAAPPVHKPSVRERLTVQGITVLGNGNFRTIINEETYQVGDRVLGARIRQITNKKVLFHHREGNFSLSIN